VADVKHVQIFPPSAEFRPTVLLATLTFTLDALIVAISVIEPIVRPRAIIGTAIAERKPSGAKCFIRRCEKLFGIQPFSFRIESPDPAKNSSSGFAAQLLVSD